MRLVREKEMVEKRKGEESDSIYQKSVSSQPYIALDQTIARGAVSGSLQVWIRFRGLARQGKQK